MTNLKDVDAMVGSYLPSKNCNQFTHFAVMDSNNNALLASCGYFQSLENPKKWSVSDYNEAVENIRQAQLYANAYNMLEALTALIENPSTENIEKAKIVKAKALDIAEPTKRLLGKDLEVIKFFSETS